MDKLALIAALQFLIAETGTATSGERPEGEKKNGPAEAEPGDGGGSAPVRRQTCESREEERLGPELAGSVGALE